MHGDSIDPTVISRDRVPHHLLWVCIAVLVVTVGLLAIAAKRSQYPASASLDPTLAQSVKMDQSRAVRGLAIVVAVATPLHAARVVVEPVEVAPDPPRAAPIRCVPSICFRPPPVA